MSKKIISMVMSLIVATSLIGCNNTAGNAEKKVETATEDKMVIKI